MKKIFITAALAGSAVAFAQTGKVGVNAATPQATLDIQPSAANAAATATTNEGLLIPRLTKARVAAITAANRVEGTQVYVTDDVLATDNATFTGTGKGFYYYDAAAGRWVKMGAGTATVTTAQNGLSLNGTAVELGGTLLKNTNIDQAGFNLSTSGAGNFGVGTNTPSAKFSVENRVLVERDSSPLGVTIAQPDTEWSRGYHFSNKAGTTNFGGFFAYGNGENVTPNSLLYFGIGGIVYNPATAPNPGPQHIPVAEFYPSTKRTILRGDLQIDNVAQNDSANQVLVRNASGLVQYRDAATLAGTSATTASNGLTATGSDIQLGGTLTQATTVNQGTNNMTFTNTGAGQFVVNGTTNLNGAVYGNTRTDNTPGPVVYTPTDYVVVITNIGKDGNMNLPSASANPGRFIYLLNGTQDQLNFITTGTDTTPYNYAVINPSAGAGFVSNGTTWYVIGR